MTISNHASNRFAGQRRSPPPISKLTEDLLWQIFMINTDNPTIMTPYQHNVKGQTPRPLEITRLSSQVCQEWRTLILSSTAIWGRLIDFVSFNQRRTEHWRNEVISRSGTSSLLWVMEGDIHPYVGAPRATGSRSFLLQFIADRWERIEKMHVNRWTGEDWSFLCRPAPYLKACEIHTMFDSQSSTQMSSITGSIFDDHAPKLTVFQTTGARCNLTMNWMKNLRSLTLGGGFINRDVFRIISDLPLLEALDLYGHVAEIDYQPPVVNLPRLYTMNIDTCLEYVRSIQPPPGCSFRFRENRDTILSKLSRDTEMGRIYQSYMDIRRPSAITLMCTKRRFVLQSGIFHEFSQETPEMEVNFTSHTGMTLNFVEHLFQTCTAPSLSEVTRLSVKIVRPRPKLLAAFKQFASSLSSLHCLQLDEETLNIMVDWDQDAACSLLVFPRLQVLKMVHLSRNIYISGSIESESPLERFLAQRRRMGAPIQTLDFTHFEDLTVWLLAATKDIEFLEEFAGLKVLYKKGGVSLEYECGSGRPELLGSIPLRR